MTTRGQSGRQTAADRQVGFSARMDSEEQEAEDQDTARVVTRFQGGDREAFAILYSRYFDRIYAYLYVAFKRRHEAEDAAQQVFTQALEALDGYQRRRQPFRAWLFKIARNYTLRQLELQGRVELMDPAQLNSRREALAAEDPDLSSILEWITDQDLLIFVERLPLPQRQALMLRFLLDMPSDEIAQVMGIEANNVRTLQHRALSFLRERLGAVRGIDPDAPDLTRRDRTARRQVREAPVMRARRYSLTKRQR